MKDKEQNVETIVLSLLAPVVSSKCSILFIQDTNYLLNTQNTLLLISDMTVNIIFIILYIKLTNVFL
jgi:hypothetical protein